MTGATQIAAVFSLSACLAACSITDPFERPSVWHPTGANEANLAAMLVNPADLARGRGLGPSDGVAAAAAIDRLHQDRVKPLSSANSTTSAPSPGAAPAAN